MMIKPVNILLRTENNSLLVYCDAVSSISDLVMRTINATDKTMDVIIKTIPDMLNIHINVLSILNSFLYYISGLKSPHARKTTSPFSSVRISLE